MQKFLNKGLTSLRHRNKIIREEEISLSLPSPSKIYMHWGVWQKPCVIFRPDCGQWQRLSQAGLPGKAFPPWHLLTAHAPQLLRELPRGLGLLGPLIPFSCFPLPQQIHSYISMCSLGPRSSLDTSSEASLGDKGEKPWGHFSPLWPSPPCTLLSFSESMKLLECFVQGSFNREVTLTSALGHLTLDQCLFSQGIW